MSNKPKEPLSERSQALRSGDSNGIVEYSKKVDASKQDSMITVGGSVSLENAVRDYFAKKGIGPKGQSAPSTPEYTSSKEVIEAITSGKLPKREAITYAEKFKLVSADKVDDLTPSAAFDLLNSDIDTEALYEQRIAETVSPGSDWHNKSGEPMKHMDQPTPDGDKSAKDQFPSKERGNQSQEVNRSKPEEKFPSPDGAVNPSKMSPHSTPTQADEVNKAKPEDPEKVTPKKVGNTNKKAEDIKSQMPNTQDGSAASDVNTAKPEDGIPNPDGSVNPKGQMPSTENGKQSADTNKAKPEDGQPAPKKAQMGMPSALEDEALDGIGAGMDGPEAPEDGPMPPMPKPEGGDMPSMAEGSKPHSTFLKMLGDATDLLADVKEFVGMMDDRLNKKEKKKKPSAGGDSPFGGGEKKEEKSESKPEKSEPKKEEKSEAPEKKEEKKEDGPPALPPVEGYKVDLVKDEKSPVDSYYVVSLKGKPVFSISVRQAFDGEKNIEKEVPAFQSAEYAKMLTAELNRVSAKEVFKNVFGSKGMILAQMDMPAGPSGGSPKPDGLPEDKFNAPAGPMNVGPEATQNMANDDTKRETFSDGVLDFLATVISSSEGKTAEEAVNELKSVFSDDGKSSEFTGKLAAKVDEKRKNTDLSNTPDANLPKPEVTTPEAAPKPEEVSAMASKLAEIKKIWPSIKEALKERDELKAREAARQNQDVVKARALKTKAMAQELAKFGLIDAQDVETESLRLAKLSDAELGNEYKNFQNSLKIATKIKEKDDYSKIEGSDTVKTANVLSAIPNQVQETIGNEVKYAWSKGIHNSR